MNEDDVTTRAPKTAEVRQEWLKREADRLRRRRRKETLIDVLLLGAAGLVVYVILALVFGG